MKKGSLSFIITTIFCGIFSAAQAQLHRDTIPDTLSLESAVVNALRKSADHHPLNSSYLTPRQISVNNTGRDLPLFTQFLPSVVTTSDAGNGIGYTGLRIRGTDATRVNVTINGVPLNDPESQGVFWVNLPDFASSLQSITIQRGVGASTNGPGAFGGSILLETQSPSKPYAHLQTSAGSFGTLRQNIAMGTGMLNNGFTFDARLSYITSNGYIDRAFTHLQSYFVSAGYKKGKFTSKLIHFNGKEHTFQAWWGTPREKLLGDSNALKNHYYRNLGTTYRNSADSANLFNSGRTYNYYTYKNETDNYQQAQYQWLNSFATGKHSIITTTLYWVQGKGFFEQYRYNDKLSDYQLPSVIFGNDTITRSDLVRRRWLDNSLYGFNATFTAHLGTFRWVAGIASNGYRGMHFGTLEWARFASTSAQGQRYYEGSGNKNDANAFMRISNTSLNNQLTAILDLQIRSVRHWGAGNDNDGQSFQFDRSFLFFNPKLSVKYQINKQWQWISDAGIANREPARTDFIDNPINTAVKPERLYDLESGLEWRRKNNQHLTQWLRANAYWMQYNHQLVLTGALNDVGAALRTNVESSYRAGIELEGSWQLLPQLTLWGNATFSKNKIRSYTEQLNDYLDYSIKDTTFNQTDIAYSPSRVGALGISYQFLKDVTATYQHKWVSSQYLDNTSNENRMLEGYDFAELTLRWENTFKSGVRIACWVQCINLWNRLYSNNGYTFSYYYGKPANYQPITEVFLFPQATQNFLTGLNIYF